MDCCFCRRAQNCTHDPVIFNALTYFLLTRAKLNPPVWPGLFHKRIKLSLLYEQYFEETMFTEQKVDKGSVNDSVRNNLVGEL